MRLNKTIPLIASKTWILFKSAVALFCSIFLTTFITQKITPFPDGGFLLAALGASAIILYSTHHYTPYSKLWVFAGGHLFSALVGVSCALYIHDITMATATAVSGSFLVMRLFRCLTPPGAATALAPVVSSQDPELLGYYFVLTPVGINVLVMLLFAILINQTTTRPPTK